MMMDSRTACLVRALAMLAATTLVACSKSDQDQTQRTIERSAGDAWLCAQARAAATALDPATVSLVKIECSPGTVALRGEVRSAQERDQLIAAVGKIDGVKAVFAQIRVNPKAPTGNEIADDVTLATKVHVALAGQTGVNALKIGVAVHNGVATLTGDVPSPAIKTVAVDATRGVKGIKGVVDKLEVQR
jgi:osmotically-inducible protein OsmY